jgi:hypothetical protein
MSRTPATSGAPPVRASDAERDQAAEILRAGYAEGRLSRAELDERLTAAYAAKTRADLCDLISDLPVMVSASPTPDGQPSAILPIMDPESVTGTQLNVCLLLCLLFAFPPAGIAYWILTARRQPQPTVPERPPLPGARASAGSPNTCCAAARTQRDETDLGGTGR